MTFSSKTLQFVGLHVILPVGIGAMLYLLWRSPTLLVFTWARSVRLIAVVQTLRDLAAGWNSLLSPSLLYSLPDGLWVYSMTTCMLLIWNDFPLSVYKVLWVSSATILACAAEGLQFFGICPGTYDSTDVVMSLLAAVLALLLGSRSLSFAKRRCT